MVGQLVRQMVRTQCSLDPEVRDPTSHHQALHIVMWGWHPKHTLRIFRERSNVFSSARIIRGSTSSSLPTVLQEQRRPHKEEAAHLPYGGLREGVRQDVPPEGTPALAHRREAVCV